MEGACEDTCSSANSRQVVVKHWEWDVDVDFHQKKLRCTTTLQIRTLCEGVRNLVLDCLGLAVVNVRDCSSGEGLSYDVKQLEGALTTCLEISLPSSCAKKHSELSVSIQYSTDPEKCTAVQWLEPAQTAGKTHPYLYTQCEAIHARSMLPCQDTPSVKSTFSAKVSVPCELVALMSGERLHIEVHPTNPPRHLYYFTQKVPIPVYLTALVVGALESRSIGPRSHVWCEKEMVEAAAWEFQETEKMLCAAEEIVGEYVWGHYDILVLPPSFAYGGMENPCLTFVSPSLLAGDRSLANVIAHELSHSWTGNLVTNVNWEHFWMNEGFTTYLERRIAAKLFSEQERHLQALIGWKTLVDAVETFEKQGKPQYSALVPQLKGSHPDEVYSSVPYEKGSAFLLYLETLLDGPGSLDGFLRAYIAKFQYGTVSTEQWKEFFLEFFGKEVAEGVFAGVEWDKWLSAPGLPPIQPKFDTTLTDASRALADKWAAAKDNLSDATFSSEDISGMSSGAIQLFLDELRSKTALPVEVLEAINTCYGFNDTQNAEIKFRWLRLCLKAKWNVAYTRVVDMLSQHGRMKYIVPLYRELFESDKDGQALALSTFAEHQHFYNTVAARKISKILKLSD